MSRDLYTAAQFIEAIKGSGGIVSTIAKRIGCTWHTAKKYIDTYSTIEVAYNAECERVDDLAESILITSIKEGNTQDAKWWLARKRKDKFSERQEVTGVNGNKIEIEISYTDEVSD